MIAVDFDFYTLARVDQPVAEHPQRGQDLRSGKFREQRKVPKLLQKQQPEMEFPVRRRIPVPTANNTVKVPFFP